MLWAVEGTDAIFHLAADHCRPGYMDLHQATWSQNLMLDGMVCRACYQAGVDKVSLFCYLISDHLVDIRIIEKYDQVQRDWQEGRMK